MGGIAALRAVRQLKVESVTEWRRLSLDARAHPTILRYERSTDLRDYSTPAWRYTRSFLGPAGNTEIVDVVTDSVASNAAPSTRSPDNAAR